MKKKIIVGASGASGMPLLKRCLEIIKEDNQYEVYLVLTEGAKLTIQHEINSLEEIKKLADYYFEPSEIGAKIASGSFDVDGMLIVPCSMKTVAGICYGYTDNLLLRAADVIIKEQKKLIIVPREAPLSTIHLKNLYELSKINGVKIIPPMLVFYHKPENLDDILNHISARILESFNIEMKGYRRWKGL